MNGSLGVPRQRLWLSATIGALAAILAMGLVAVGDAAATKFYDSFFGNTSATATGVPATPAGTAYGTTFGSGNGGVGDVAVNSPSITTDGGAQTGFVYVVDRGNNRISVFDQNRSFQFSIGRDVIAPTVNEHQNLTVAASAGQYRLRFNGQTTGDLAYDATASTIQTQLRALSTIGASNVNVTGGPGSPSGSGPYVISFVGTLAAADQAALEVVVGTTPLTGAATLATVANGTASTPGNTGTGFEKCTVAVHCKAGTTGSLGGEFSVAQGIDIDQATGHFFVSERDPNRRVQEFTADGQFVRAFGFDVDQGAGAGGGGGGTLLNERQRVALDDGAGGFLGGVVSGTFTLTFNGQTTAAIPYNATAGQVQAALEGLSNVDPGDVLLSGGPGPSAVWTVDFAGQYLGANVSQITGTSVDLLTGLATPGVVVTSTLVQGGPSPTFETCVVASQCQPASAAGTQPGQFGSNSGTNINGLAVAPPGAPNAGKVYVADPGNRRVLPFSVPANGLSAVVAETPFGSATQFSTANWPRDVAADSNGIVYATWGGSGSATSVDADVFRYDTVAGAFEQSVSPNVDDGHFDRSMPTSLEIDQLTGHLLAGRAPSSAGDGAAFAAGIVELDLSENPENVETSHRVDLHAVGLGSVISTSSPTALGVGNGRLYLPTSATATGAGVNQRVLVLDDTGIDPPPTVTMFPASAVGGTTATVSATINPNATTGFTTGYTFELSKDGVDWTSVGSGGNVGDGGSPVPVSEALSGLEPNTSYRVRVRTTRSPGAGIAVSAEVVFVTDPVPPHVTTDGASRVAHTTAQLNGRLNPGGVAAEYWFAWGDDSYGNTAPAPAATRTSSIESAVSQTISGLEPERVYHYRLCATNALAATPVCGEDRTLTTRAVPTSEAAGRAYEMVTPPMKALRRGGERGPGGPLEAYGRVQNALPAPSGGSALWSVFAGVTDLDAGNHFAHERAWELRSRGPGGWTGKAIMNVPTNLPIGAADSVLTGVSADLRTQGWFHQGALFPSQSKSSFRVMGDTGGPLSAGWYPWLDQAWFAGNIPTYGNDAALIADDGSHALRWNFQNGLNYRDVRPLDATVPPNALTPPQTAGSAVFLTGPEAGWAPADLVNECTGSSAAATEIPSRSGTGLSTDTLTARACEQGSPTSVRGGVPGSGSNTSGGPLSTTSTTAMSDDGKRVFFLSPDPTTSATNPPATGSPREDGRELCTTTTASATQCPPQLFVRQYDDDGNATVRWISRAVPGLFAAPQQIGLVGGGVSFEGASRDGAVVYFRTNAPLTPDDPNGTGASPPVGGVVSGAASPQSWDLYRYELPGDNDVDPANGSLVRVSGGPDGTADPNTNCNAVPTAGTESGRCAGSVTPGGGSVPAGAYGSPNGGGAAARFISDDGRRVYFVTAARIPGADNGRPAGGAIDPTAPDAQVNTSERNLYLYDAAKSGAAAYKFVTRLPFGASGARACASFEGNQGGPARSVDRAGSLATLPERDANCVHGSSAGDAIAFETPGRLTADDTDDATDIYLYDAATDELVRVSAPTSAGTAYACMTVNPDSIVAGAMCNADLGIQAGDPTPPGTQETVGRRGLRNQNIAETATGEFKALYFESQRPLTDADTNGARMDVYEWRDGTVSLISPGNADRDAFYTGNSRDGDEVFFWTDDRIDPREIDEKDGDLYVSKVGGGIPLPAPPPVICAVLADGCQAPGADAIDTPVETGAQGDNVAPGARARLSLARPSSVALRRAARSGVLAVRVSVPRSGRLAVSARARIGKSRRVVGSTATRVGKPGVKVVKIRLSKAARKAISAGRGLRIELDATIAGARPGSLSLQLRRARK